jgi:hypothetical protein
MLQRPEQVLHQLRQGIRVQVAPLHPFRRIVIRLQAHGRKRQFRRRVNIRMGDVDASVEHGRLSENDVFLVGLILSGYELQALEPDQVHDTGTVGEMTDQPPLPPLSQRLEAQDLSPQLDVWHVPVDFTDEIHPASVYVLVREIIQQVLEGIDFQLLVQDSRTLRSYPLQILDVSCSQIEHIPSMNFPIGL